MGKIWQVGLKIPKSIAINNFDRLAVNNFVFALSVFVFQNFFLLFRALTNKNG
jgi:hypothetical protein